MDAGGRRHAMDDRRRVSFRWLLGTVLTGLSGAGLMAAAVVGTHDNNRSQAKAPQLTNALRSNQSAQDRSVTSSRKGDKLVRAADLTSAKHSFKTPTTIRTGDREVIRAKSFTRLSAPLLLVGGAYQDEIPPFNPLKLLTDAGADRSIEAIPTTGREDAEAEVSIILADLGVHQGTFSRNTLSDAEVRAQVKETAAVPRRQVPSIPPQMLLARTLQSQTVASFALGIAPSDPIFSRIEVRMVDENVTVVPKMDTAQPQETSDEKLITPARGQTLEQALRANGAVASQARAISAALKDRPLVEGQRLRILTSPMDSCGPRQLVRVMVIGDDAIEAIAAMTDRCTFVSVAPPSAVPTKPEDEEDEAEGGLALYNSLYETALKNDIPRPLVDELIRILSSDSDTDFQRRVTGGDAIDMLMSEDDDGDAREILYASLSAAGETKRFYRFVNPDDSSVDYFDENGRSAKKFLMRKPMVGGQFRSGFGMRRHPIQGYSKMHTGVDYADRVGSPILAAGNGVVIKAGWDSGYGRRIELQHANGYVTTYNHMSGFARNIQPGVRVRQSSVIGYLGNTGLSTGPHLHYEVIVNDRYVDPLRIRIPRGRELEGRMLADFRRERERIDNLRQRAPGATRVGELVIR
jgi:murein DD-endopeptidase MepM/ murein hydrolase activator NlpD